MSRFQQTDLQRDISREFQNGPPTVYDKLLSSIRFTAPKNLEHPYRCREKKAQAADKALKESKKKGEEIRNWTMK